MMQRASSTSMMIPTPVSAPGTTVIADVQPRATMNNTHRYQHVLIKIIIFLLPTFTYKTNLPDIPDIRATNRQIYLFSIFIFDAVK